VLKTAMLVFSRHGYKKTATQQIAEAAGVSKGMVFHYFTSKLALFELLCQTTADFFKAWAEILTAEIIAMDYIDRYSWLARRKLEAYLQEPERFAFISMLMLHPENQQVSEKVAEISRQLAALQEEVLVTLAHSGDTGRFREDLAPGDIRRYITFILEGYTQEVMAALKDQPAEDLSTSPSWAAFDALLQDLRTLFYQ